MPIHGIAIPRIIDLLAEVDGTTIQYSGAPHRLNLKAPYRNSIYNNPRVGSIMPWLKTFHQIVADNNDAIVVDKLSDSSVNFVTLGIQEGDIVINDATGAWATVMAIDSPTVLSLSVDIFPAQPVAYRIFDTPSIPVGWVECNGNVINDALSRWDGLNAPDLNGTPSFMRGNTESGGVGGSETHLHSVSLPLTPTDTGSGAVCYGAATNLINTGNTSTLPTYYEVVMIFKTREIA